jgi:2-oxoglutarate dehydrogenase complex dehydrogenase (E1) component-like enzyme
VTDVDGLNSGFARDLLEEYLENPDSVPTEWRELFESGRSDVVATHPGLIRLLERTGNGQPAPAPPAEPARPSEAEPVTDELLGAVAAAMALVKAQRMHGHLAARLDPLGSEPPGDPALEPERLIP